MADGILLKAGGVADLDVITAAAADVRAGKVIVNKEGDPVTGTEAERGAWTGNVGMNGTITVPEGHHNGAGKVTGPVVTQRGGWASRIGINGRVQVPEGYHNGQGYVDQAVATMGGQTVAPGVSQKVVYCSGKYMTGNVVVQGLGEQPYRVATIRNYNTGMANTVTVPATGEFVCFEGCTIEIAGTISSQTRNHTSWLSKGTTKEFDIYSVSYDGNNLTFSGKSNGAIAGPAPCRVSIGSAKVVQRMNL